jgi:hypothetical protein
VFIVAARFFWYYDLCFGGKSFSFISEGPGAIIFFFSAEIYSNKIG